MEISNNMYDEIRAEYAKRLEKIGDKEAIIDFNWAINFLNE